MNAAVRYLRDELRWLRLARRRHERDPRVSKTLRRSQLEQLAQEIRDIEAALEILEPMPRTLEQLSARDARAG